jgi:hypothetical protein
MARAMVMALEEEGNSKGKKSDSDGDKVDNGK